MNKKTAPGSTPLETALFARLATALPAHDLPGQQRELMRQRVMRSVSGQPAGTTTVHASGGEWVALTPLVMMKVLRIDAQAGNQTVMVRARAGGRLPRHRHGHDEEFIVLEGECRIGNLHLRAGDAHFAAAGSWHDEITTDTGVLVLVRGEYPAPASV
jgi:quercetin dioxygenase-like cupin family protein